MSMIEQFQQKSGRDPVIEYCSMLIKWTAKHVNNVNNVNVLILDWNVLVMINELELTIPG